MTTQESRVHTGKTETMMTNANSSLLIVLAIGLLLQGCGKPQTDSNSRMAEDEPAPTPSAPEISTPVRPVPGPSPQAVQAGSVQGGAFATARPSVKKSYERGLRAYEAGNYAQALTELKEIPGTTQLTSEQGQLVQELRAKAELGLAGTRATLPAGGQATAAPGAARTTDTLQSPEAPSEAPQTSMENPFADSAPPIQENFNSALIAYQIADYSKAVAELELLAETEGLTPQQKALADYLLAKARQELAKAGTQPGSPPTKP